MRLGLVLAVVANAASRSPAPQPLPRVTPVVRALAGCYRLTAAPRDVAAGAHLRPPAARLASGAVNAA